MVSILKQFQFTFHHSLMYSTTMYFPLILQYNHSNSYKIIAKSRTPHSFVECGVEFVGFWTVESGFLEFRRTGSCSIPPDKRSAKLAARRMPYSYMYADAKVSQ